MGDQFSMADVIFGGTLRCMLTFDLIEPRAAFSAYATRPAERPALRRADAVKRAVMVERGLVR